MLVSRKCRQQPPAHEDGDCFWERLLVDCLAVCEYTRIRYKRAVASSNKL